MKNRAEYAAAFARKGGRARAKNLSTARRHEIAVAAGLASGAARANCDHPEGKRTFRGTRLYCAFCRRVIGTT
jgi:hypothetical protein